MIKAVRYKNGVPAADANSAVVTVTLGISQQILDLDITVNFDKSKTEFLIDSVDKDYATSVVIDGNHVDYNKPQAGQGGTIGRISVDDIRTIPALKDPLILIDENNVHSLSAYDLINSSVALSPQPADIKSMGSTI